jgi:amidase
LRTPQSWTSRCTAPSNRDYTQFLDADALRGARIGIPRAYFYDAIVPPGGARTDGLAADQRAAMEEAIAILKGKGAVIVDPANVPSVVDADPERNLLRWNVCSGLDNARGQDQRCSIVFKYGMKRDFNVWLASLGDRAPVRTLAELRAWNVKHRDAGTLKYGQANLDISDEIDLDRDRARYEADRKKDLFLTAEHGIDEVMKANRLDALLFPGGTGAALAAKPGYPTVIVPFALVTNAPAPSFPSDFAARGAPFGVSFTGMACSEPRLIALAYAFEQATKRRVPPALFP